MQHILAVEQILSVFCTLKTKILLKVATKISQRKTSRYVGQSKIIRE
jgi:hypothetical protein